MTSEVRGSQTVIKALRILELFIEDGAELTLTEVSNRVELTLSTTYRLLKALRERGFVAFDPRSKHYSLGTALMRAGLRGRHRESLILAATPLLEQIRTETEETAALHWRVGERRVCVQELVSKHNIRLSSGIGHSYPLDAGAAGKAMLAWLDEESLLRLLDGAGDHGADGLEQADRTRHRRARAELLDELATIRARGYATSQGEVVEGSSALAAAVRDADDRPICAINVTGPAFRWTAERVEVYAPRLLEIVRRLASAAESPVF